jgi:hypothetical protein
MHPRQTQIVSEMCWVDITSSNSLKTRQTDVIWNLSYFFIAFSPRPLSSLHERSRDERENSTDEVFILSMYDIGPGRCNCIGAVKSVSSCSWSLSQSQTRPTHVRSSERESVSCIEIMTLKLKIIQQNNEIFYQPNPGVVYISHSSVRTCKQGCTGFLVMRLRFRYNARSRLWIWQL